MGENRKDIDRRAKTKAEHVESAHNPVGNGQGDAQADDPKNEMNDSGETAQGAQRGDRR